MVDIAPVQAPREIAPIQAPVVEAAQAYQSPIAASAAPREDREQRALPLSGPVELRAPAARRRPAPGGGRRHRRHRRARARSAPAPP